MYVDVERDTETVLCASRVDNGEETRTKERERREDAAEN